MIPGIPDAPTIDRAWSAYSSAVQISLELERMGAAPHARATQALRAHRLHRAFLLMSELAEIGARLEPRLTVVPATSAASGKGRGHDAD